MRTRSAPVVSVAMSMAFLYTGSAFAQVDTGSPAQGLTAAAHLTAIYDDNVFRSFTNLPDRKRADYRLSPSVSARYDVPVSGQGLFVEGAVGYNFYLRNDGFDRGWWRAGTGVDWRLGTRCSGVAAVNYSETQSDFGDLGIAVNNLEKRQYYNLNASCVGPVGIGVVAGVDYAKTNNTFFARERGNLESISYSGGLLYRSILIGDITLRGVHEDRKFPNRHILGQRDGVTVDRISLGVARPLAARLSGSAGVSYIWSKPDVSFYQDFKGVGWNADLTYLVGPKLVVGVSASRDATSSAAIDSTYQLTRSLGAYANYKLSSRTNFTVGATDRRRSFRGTDTNNPFLLIPPRGIEKTRQYYAEAGYAPAERWGLALRYMHEKRDSDVNFYDYDGNSVMLTATIRY